MTITITAPNVVNIPVNVGALVTTNTKESVLVAPPTIDPDDVNPNSKYEVNKATIELLADVANQLEAINQELTLIRTYLVKKENG